MLAFSFVKKRDICYSVFDIYSLSRNMSGYNFNEQHQDHIQDVLSRQTQINRDEWSIANRNKRLAGKVRRNERQKSVAQNPLVRLVKLLMNMMLYVSLFIIAVVLIVAFQ